MRCKILDNDPSADCICQCRVNYVYEAGEVEGLGGFAGYAETRPEVVVEPLCSRARAWAERQVAQRKHKRPRPPAPRLDGRRRRGT